jgi:chromosome segregation ATPase
MDKRNTVHKPGRGLSASALVHRFAVSDGIAIVVLSGAFTGAVKLIEMGFQKQFKRTDENSEIRKELRNAEQQLWQRLRDLEKENSERIAGITKSYDERIAILQTAVDDWRTKYYDMRDKHGQLVLEHEDLKRDYAGVERMVLRLQEEIDLNKESLKQISEGIDAAAAHESSGPAEPAGPRRSD